MDINSILPLLLGKTNMGDKAKLFAALSGENPEELLAKSLGQEMSGLINLLKNKKTRSRKAAGLDAVLSFAPADIVGTLYKLLNAG